jgi:hypothetical protein
MAHQIPQAVNAIATPRIYVPNIDGEIIQVQAGEQLFHIHEGVLRQYLFFIDAIKPECVSGRNGKPIDLSNENAITFAAYQQYLYSHQTDTTLNEHLWYRMYVLREMLMDVEFQDAVLDVIMSGYHESGLFPHPTEIAIIFEGTTENSPARALFVDFFCLQKQGLDVIQYNNYFHRVPADFNKHLLTVLLQNQIEIN